MGNKKLTASLVLFIISLISLGGGIYALISYFSAETNSPMAFLLALLPLIFYVVLMFISQILNYLYRKDEVRPGAFSTALLVLSCVLCPPIVINVIALALLGLFMKYFGSGVYSANYGSNTVKAEDAEGKEHTLTPTWEDGIAVKKQYYNDGDGNEWVSQDNGETFESVIKKVKGEDGKEYTLTPKFKGYNEYYIDQNGDDWRIRADGKFERWEK